MPSLSQESDSFDDHHLLLTQPDQWLPLLGSGKKAEFFFYILDLNRNLKFVSDSVWDISRIRPEDWLNRSIMPILTDHIWNEFLSNSDADLEPNTVYRLKVEVWDSASNRVRLETWRRLITHRSAPIGVVGMAKRFQGPAFSEVAMGSLDPADLRKRIATLTTRELEVVKFVVRGELNKSIAKKLNVSMRTVEARRSKAMEKLGVTRLSELIRVWISEMESSDGEPGNG